MLIHIPAIIEDYSAQPFLERYWKAGLGIEDEELVTAGRDANLGRASCGIIWVGAENGNPLRACPVQWKASQAVRSSGKKLLADGNVASGKRCHQSQADIIGPYQPGLDLPVICGLPKKTDYVVAGADQFRADAEIHSLEYALVCIERLIACIAYKGSRQRGGSHRLVFGWDEVSNEKISECSALKGIAKLQSLRLGSVQNSFKLKRTLTESRSEKRILSGPLSGETPQGIPV